MSGDSMVNAYRYTCTDDAFQVRSENRDEVIDMVRDHAQDTHDMSMSREDVEDGLEEVQA